MWIEPVSMIVPAIASLALGGALLVPIRDGRQGRKATISGRRPLSIAFSSESASAGTIPPDGPIVQTTTNEPRAAVRSDVESQHETKTVDATPPRVRSGETIDDEHEAARDETSAAPEDGIEFAYENSGPVDDHEKDDRARAFVRSLAGETNDRGKSAGGEGPALTGVADIVRGAFVRLRSNASAYISAFRIPHTEQVELDDAVIERSFADELARLIAVRDAEPPAVTTSAPEGALPEANDPEHETPVPIFATSSMQADPAERIVPLTRLPLRFAAREIGWPASMSPPLHFDTDAERYAFLHHWAHHDPAGGDVLLARVFHEETTTGRKVALAAFNRECASAAAVDTFVAALTTGSDEERSLAIDALAEVGAHEEIARALNDRIDAIAAKAALTYVGTTARNDYRAALAPFLDDTRIDTVLELLAGVVE